jgi:UDP-glucose 4-epimerase
MRYGFAEIIGRIVPARVDPSFPGEQDCARGPMQAEPRRSSGEQRVPEEASGVVLVTGARGMVGGFVAAELQRAGFTVRAASRMPDIAGPWRETCVLPAHDAESGQFRQAVSGVAHVVHAAALNSDAAASEADFMNANAVLTGRLAEAAAASVPGRFIFVSSIRAVAEAGGSTPLDERTSGEPLSAYGRSKQAAERAAMERYGEGSDRLVRLRPAPIYGNGMRGGLARLLRLADTPFPLPFGGIRSRRSLLSAESMARAVVHLIISAQPPAPAYIVSDRHPIGIDGIIAAFREGLERPRRLFATPPGLLSCSAALAGASAAWQSLAAEEICDPSALIATGWKAVEDSYDGLSALARSAKAG